MRTCFGYAFLCFRYFHCLLTLSCKIRILFPYLFTSSPISFIIQIHQSFLYNSLWFPLFHIPPFNPLIACLPIYTISFHFILSHACLTPSCMFRPQSLKASFTPPFHLQFSLPFVMLSTSDTLPF